MNSADRKPLPGTSLAYFDAQAAVERIQAGAWAKLPYTSRVLAENEYSLQAAELHHGRGTCWGVQYHPESSAGPHDSHYLFGRFRGLMGA